MRPLFYKLDSKKQAVPIKELAEATLLLRNRDARQVAWNQIDTTQNGLSVCISTVFLVIDQNAEENGEPVLFETSIYLEEKKSTVRYHHTYYEALKGYDEIFQWMREHAPAFVMKQISAEEALPVSALRVIKTELERFLGLQVLPDLSKSMRL